MSSRIQFTLAVLLGTCACTFAAEKLPVVISDQSPAAGFKPTSNWYLLGSLSYVASDPVYDYTQNGEDSQTRRFGYTVGTGYRLNERLRGDITTSYITRESYSDPADATNSGRLRIWSMLLNGYYDIGTYADFTPYVGAGVGLMRTLDTMPETFSGTVPGYNSSQTEFAFALNAGVGYRMSDSLTFDMGYQFLASPTTQYVDYGSGTVEDGLNLHQLRIGFRYTMN
ncbi:MAG: outer membrane beta-barrel protein [Rhizobiaceae bacterium]|nr:outer membrane beta-barrel protein [Rhizobiaceae bacterium]